MPTDAGRQRTRRSWTVEQKLAIMREVQESGDPVAVVARRHDMNANHLHIWMKQTRERRSGDRSETPPIAFIEMGVVAVGVPVPRLRRPKTALGGSMFICPRWRKWAKYIATRLQLVDAE
ncbi:transposase [Mesorhizobium cantuariense]|uniref:Transposase n=1 Tax=Mesorhizobium cantuariense TaxID=1300275 RepID=A0ABV7MIM1_9HYPH|nr:transposase [Mesorhizobium sophorae]